MTASPILKTKTASTGLSPIDARSPTTKDVTPEDILNETGRLSAALETFCDLLRSKQSNLASAYQTYEALWNHYILLLRLFDDYRWTSRMKRDGDKSMILRIEAGFTRLLPVVKQAKVALNNKMKEAAQILAVVENTDGDNKDATAAAAASAAMVRDVPETPQSPVPRSSGFNLFKIGLAARRKTQDGITTSSSSPETGA